MLHESNEVKKWKQIGKAFWGISNTGGVLYFSAKHLISIVHNNVSQWQRRKIGILINTKTQSWFCIKYVICIIPHVVV